MTQCASLNLRNLVAPDPNPYKNLPTQLYERTGHICPVDKNPIQAEVNKLKAYARDNQKVIHEARTKVMLLISAMKKIVSHVMNLDAKFYNFHLPYLVTFLIHYSSVLSLNTEDNQFLQNIL